MRLKLVDVYDETFGLGCALVTISSRVTVMLRAHLAIIAAAGD